MAKRKAVPTPLEVVRAKTTKHGQDILALKAAVVDLQSRVAKAETALGTIGKGELPPNVEREDTRDEPGEEQPETE